MQPNLHLPSTQFHLPVRRVCGCNVIMRMHQYNQDKIDSLGTGPEFDERMHFYIHMDVIFVELNDCYNNEIGRDKSGLGAGEQPFVWVLNMPIIYTRTGIESRIFSCIGADLGPEEYSLTCDEELIGVNHVNGVGMR